MDEVESLAHAHVGHSLVDDLLDLDGRDADGERRADNDPVLGVSLAGDQRGELRHQARPRIEAPVLKHLVEGEVVEGLDEFRVGLLQGRDVVREELVVDLLRALADGHQRVPTRTSDLIARRSSMAA